MNNSCSHFFLQQKFKMIDLQQWRVCIGKWCHCLKPLKRKSGCRNQQNQQNQPQWIEDCLGETNTLQLCICSIRELLSHASVLLYTLAVCIFLLLVLSGDVEKNPGPIG